MDVHPSKNGVGIDPWPLAPVPGVAAARRQRDEGFPWTGELRNKRGHAS